MGLFSVPVSLGTLGCGGGLGAILGGSVVLVKVLKLKPALFQLSPPPDLLHGAAKAGNFGNVVEVLKAHELSRAVVRQRVVESGPNVK